MRRIAMVCLLVLLPVFSLWGQIFEYKEDTLQVYPDIFEVLRSTGPYGNRITLIQSDSIAHKVNSLVEINKQSQGKMQGFRVRIFFDNKQTARAESEEIATAFSEAYPQVAVYRIYENPYFKVTVGDFRTRSQAMQFMLRIRRTYPQAFITRENISYPQL